MPRPKPRPRRCREAQKPVPRTKFRKLFRDCKAKAKARRRKSAGKTAPRRKPGWIGPATEVKTKEFLTKESSALPPPAKIPAPHKGRRAARSRSLNLDKRSAKMPGPDRMKAASVTRFDSRSKNLRIFCGMALAN